MKKLLLLLGWATVLFIGAGMVGCSDEKNDPTQTNPDENNQNGGGTQDETTKEGTTFTAGFTAETGITWNKDAKLGIFNGSDVEQLAVPVSEDGSISLGEDGKASFKTASPLTGTIYAAYPYVETMGKATTALKVNLPAAQTQGVEASFFYGSHTVAEGTAVSFDLKNVFTILELNISTSGYGVGSALTEVTVSAVDAKLAGDFDLDLTAATVAAQTNDSYTYGNSVTLAMSGDAAVLKSDAASVARLAIYPDQLEGKDLSIVVKMGDDSWSFTESGRNFLSDKVYSITLTLDTPPVNLNRTDNGLEYANCYMVNQANTVYKFDAKVQGNGKATPGITPQAIDPKVAFVVWESTASKGGVISDVTLTADGFVTFKTSETIGGNALIAVTDGEIEEGLPKGTVLWSWHIWSTDYSASNDITFTTTAGNTFSFMNINLGTIPDENVWGTLGLKYQWGRKDPFPCSGFDASGNILVSSTYNIMPGYSDEDYCWEAVNISGYGFDVLAESIAFPAMFIVSSNTGSGDWMEVADDNLWGNSSNGEGVKTIYDPSPVGYRVPPQLAFADFTFDTASDVQNGYISFSTESGTITFVPASYMLNTGRVSNANYGIKYLNNLSTYQVTGRYWTSSVNSDGYSSSFYFTKTLTNVNMSGNRVYGYPIRCIRE